MAKVRTTLSAVLAVTAIALALTACDPPGGPRVLILGDSITIEAKGSGNAAEILKGYRVDWSGVKYMTAPCNGIQVVDRLTYVPDVVVVNYSGNRGSLHENCMASERGDALAARYHQDVQTIIDRYRNGRTKVVVLGAPTRKRSLVDDNKVYDALQVVAADPANGVAFFDGGRFLTPDRTKLSRVAPCLSPRETGSKATCTGTASDKAKNYIRDSIYEHLCPNGSSLTGSCDVYSSGAVRLTLNIRDGIKAAKVPVPKP